jgi:hypothetical protein
VITVRVDDISGEKVKVLENIDWPKEKIPVKGDIIVLGKQSWRVESRMFFPTNWNIVAVQVKPFYLTCRIHA